jgi:HEAT repeat protein
MRWTLVRGGLLGLLLVSAASAQDPVGNLRSRLRSSDPQARSAALSEVVEFSDAAALAPDIAALLDAEDLSLRHEALIALGQLGESAQAAVPAIVKQLQGREPLLQMQALITLREIGPAARTALPDVDKLVGLADRAVAVEAAATSISLADKPSDAAVKTLVAALADGRPSTRAMAVYWLGVSRGAKVEELLTLLKSAPLATKIAVAELLGELRSDAAPAVAALVQLSSENQPALQATIARTLGEIAENSEAALPALSKLATNAAPTVRTQALLALGRFGGRAADQVATLQSALKDAEPAVRMAAAEALAELGSAAAPAIAALSEALKDAEGAVTIRAAEALGRIGAPAVGALSKLMDDPQFGGLAVHMLGTMGPAARPALPRIVELLKKQGALPERELCLAIAMIGGDPRTVGPVLRDVMNRKDSPARAAAVYALGRIGDKAAIKDITNLVESDDPALRLASAWALLQFDPNNPDYIKLAVPRLIQGLTHELAGVRLESVRTLGQLGPKAAAAQSALVDLLAKEQERPVRIAAAIAVSELGPGTKSAVPALSQLALSNDIPARRAAMYALGRIGEPAGEAAAMLQEKIKAGPVADRALAAWALLQVRGNQGDVQTALPVVLEAISYERPEVIVQLARVAGRFGQNRPEVRETLATLKKSDDPALRAAAWSATDRWESK